MKWSGWLFMLVSWTVILGLFVYCMARTLRSGQDNDDGRAGTLGPDE